MAGATWAGGSKYRGGGVEGGEEGWSRCWACEAHAQSLLNDKLMAGCPNMQVLSLHDYPAQTFWRSNTSSSFLPPGAAVRSCWQWRTAGSACHHHQHKSTTHDGSRQAHSNAVAHQGNSMRFLLEAAIESSPSTITSRANLENFPP